MLLSHYEGYLYRICYSFTHNKEESLDMMQEVYIKIFRSLHSFDETRPLLRKKMLACELLEV